MTDTKPKERFGLRPYETAKLLDFGRVIKQGFGHHAYQVGSSLQTTNWGDIDVVVMLPDEDYRKRFGEPEQQFARADWRAVCRAWMALGLEMTGLPIDFKVQSIDHANEHHKRERSCISFSFFDPSETAP